uniref:Uncharacterized protein n=1 Tax=Nelumbo nucifera TaxID=4432 RepID=A0A822YE85_NELNU|nr:TPA_asm: hypothetical protein HUJ06_009648 [Nelumbo nucifera]
METTKEAAEANTYTRGKGMLVEIPSETSTGESVAAAPTPTPGLMRQSSGVKMNNCLCSPTTHNGSFRCRLHRQPSLQRTKSIDSATLQELPHAQKDTVIQPPAPRAP